MRAPMHRGDRGLQSASDVNRVPEHWSPPSPAVAFATHAISITLRSPPSPAVPFATHARSNAPRRPRASKRIGSERDDGRASKESRESSDSTDSIISIISINSIRPTVIPGLLAPPPPCWANVARASCYWFMGNTPMPRGRCKNWKRACAKRPLKPTLKPTLKRHACLTPPA